MIKETKVDIYATIATLIIVGSFLEMIIFNSFYILTGIVILFFIVLPWCLWCLFKEFFKLML